MRGWKMLGLAGVAGVAATAAVLAARRRQWAEHDPEELRARLHARLAEARATGADRAGED